LGKKKGRKGLFGKEHGLGCGGAKSFGFVKERESKGGGNDATPKRIKEESMQGAQKPGRPIRGVLNGKRRLSNNRRV